MNFLRKDLLCRHVPKICQVRHTGTQWLSRTLWSTEIGRTFGSAGERRRNFERFEKFRHVYSRNGFRFYSSATTDRSGFFGGRLSHSRANWKSLISEATSWRAILSAEKAMRGKLSTEEYEKNMRSLERRSMEVQFEGIVSVDDLQNIIKEKCVDWQSSDANQHTSP